MQYANPMVRVLSHPEHESSKERCKRSPMRRFKADMANIKVRLAPMFPDSSLLLLITEKQGPGSHWSKVRLLPSATTSTIVSDPSSSTEPETRARPPLLDIPANPSNQRNPQFRNGVRLNRPNPTNQQRLALTDQQPPRLPTSTTPTKSPATIRLTTLPSHRLRSWETMTDST